MYPAVHPLRCSPLLVEYSGHRHRCARRGLRVPPAGTSGCPHRRVSGDFPGAPAAAIATDVERKTPAAASTAESAPPLLQSSLEGPWHWLDENSAASDASSAIALGQRD